MFFVGYRGDLPLLVPASTLIALVGTIRPLQAIVGGRSQAPAGLATVRDGPTLHPIAASPSNAVLARPASVITTANSNGGPAHGFDGQWFVMQITPTYDDTNSVGNVYFANYVRWVGKARELFFNACMPAFELETTRYYVLTKSFQHDFRREIAEFETATIRIRIASHNRKFVTLGHEIVSERHGLLGRGEQDLMFVDRESFKPLDIPADIIRGFLPFWPSSRPQDVAVPVPDEVRKAG